MFSYLAVTFVIEALSAANFQPPVRLQCASTVEQSSPSVLQFAGSRSRSPGVRTGPVTERTPLLHSAPLLEPDADTNAYSDADADADAGPDAGCLCNAADGLPVGGRRRRDEDGVPATAVRPESESSSGPAASATAHLDIDRKVELVRAFLCSCTVLLVYSSHVLLYECT